MRLFEILIISISIQVVILSPVQALNLSMETSRENMSPSIYMQNGSFQSAFIEKLKNDYILDVLQEKEVPVFKFIQMEALDFTTALSAEKKDEYYKILNVLDNHGFKLEISAVELGMGVKKIRRIIGADIIKIGKKQAREKEIWLQKKMLVCALRSCRWNVSQASKQTGILKKRIYELIPSEIIKAKRKIAEQELKKMIIEVLEKNEWNVRKALRNKKLIDQKVGRHILYSMLTVEWIDTQRKVYIEGIEEQQRKEIISAINMFRQERKSLTAVQSLLGLTRGTLNERMTKLKISKEAILYDPKQVLPVLVETRANITQACKILGTDRSILAIRFKNEIAEIRQTGTYIELTDVEQVLHELELIDGYLDALVVKINRIELLNAQEVNSLFDITNFSIYRCLSKIEKMPINIATTQYMDELIGRITAYNNVLIQMNQFMDCKVNDTKFIVSLLEIIAMEIKGFLGNSQTTLSAEKIFLLHKNRLRESGLAEIAIKSAI